MSGGLFVRMNCVAFQRRLSFDAVQEVFLDLSMRNLSVSFGGFGFCWVLHILTLFLCLISFRAPHPPKIKLLPITFHVSSLILSQRKRKPSKVFWFWTSINLYLMLSWHFFLLLPSLFHFHTIFLHPSYYTRNWIFIFIRIYGCILRLSFVCRFHPCSSSC